MTTQEKLLSGLRTVRERLVEVGEVVIDTEGGTETEMKNLAYIGGYIGALVATVDRTVHAVKRTI